MQIQYYGLTRFKVIAKPAGRGAQEIIVYIDPTAGEELRMVYGNADIILSSEERYNAKKEGLKGDPIIFLYPGEYSIHGVNLMAIEATGKHKKENIIFVLEAEDIRIAHLGVLTEELTSKQQESIDGVDILMIPVGGGGESIDGKQAAKIARNIAPKIVIPMYYDTPGVALKLDSVKAFCDEMGSCKSEKLAKLVVKKKDLEKRSEDIVILESQR